MHTQKNHEIEFVKNFIVKEKQDRFLTLINNKKKRNKLRLLIAHRMDFIKTNIYLIDKNNICKNDIYLILKKYGAPENCYIICESSIHDRKEMKIKEALDILFNSGLGFILSCIPGEVAYYQGENFSNIILLNNSQ